MRSSSDSDALVIVHSDTSCEKTGCCTTTDSGQAACNVTSAEQTAACECGDANCGCQSSRSQPFDRLPVIGNVRLEPMVNQATTWQKVRGGLMFGLACATSPCCTPLIVPVVLALLAGTPAAVWLGHNLGLVYGALTAISVVSAVLGWRWINSRKTDIPNGSFARPSAQIRNQPIRKLRSFPNV